MLRKGDLTQGGITGTLLHFTLPMMVGSFLQQCYNIADTLIVGQCIGAGALAAVGSAYTLMVFLISVLLGLAMGSGTVFSLHYGAGNHVALRRSIFSSFVLIGIVTLILNVAVFIWLGPILRLLQVPQDIYGMMRSYLWIIFCGIVFTFIYNFYALVSGSFCRSEYSARLVFYPTTGLGDSRCGCGHCPCSRSSCSGHHYLYLQKASGTAMAS